MSKKLNLFNKLCLFIFLSCLLLLTGCSRNDLKPPALAQIFIQCKQNQMNNLPRSKQCEEYAVEIQAIEAALISNRDANLGQSIIDAQTKLVTIEQEFAKKDMSDQQRIEFKKEVADLKQQVLVLQTVFLLAQLVQ